MKNTAIDDITFDFIYNENGKPHYFYFDADFNGGIDKSLINHIEKITTKTIPFYENEYFYLSVNRIPDSLVKLAQKYDIPYVRSHFEEFYIVPDLKSNLNIRYPLNILKLILLNILTLINKKTLTKYNLKTNNYIS